MHANKQEIKQQIDQGNKQRNHTNKLDQTAINKDTNKPGTCRPAEKKQFFLMAKKVRRIKIRVGFLSPTTGGPLLASDPSLCGIFKIRLLGVQFKIFSLTRSQLKGLRLDWSIVLFCVF